MENKHYEMKSVLHSSLSTLDGSSGTSHIKSKSILEILGTGALGCIKVIYRAGLIFIYENIPTIVVIYVTTMCKASLVPSELLNSHNRA